MWEPMKVGSIAEVKGMVLAQFQMHVVQLDGGGGARVKVDGNEYWFDGLASGYIDDRVYTFSGVIESGGTKTYQTILGAPRTYTL